VSVWPAQLIVMLEHVLNGLLHTVKISHLVEHSAHATLGTRAIVANDVEDERIFELTGGFDGVDQASDLGVGIFGETGKYLHLPREQLFFVTAKLGPIRNGVRLRCELGARRNDAELDLPCQSLFA